MLKKIVKFIRLIFDMDDTDEERNYSKYSTRYINYKL